MDRNRHMATRTVSTPDSVQADEALRRARAQKSDVRQQLARRAGLNLTDALTLLAQQQPSPNGPALRITVTTIDGGEELAAVDIDSLNADDVARLATWRAEKLRPQQTSPVRHLRSVGGVA